MKTVQVDEAKTTDKSTTELNSVKTIEENYKDLQALIECLNIDVDKFQEKKIKAAGQRARSNLLNTKKLCDTLRKQILAEIKAIPVKHRFPDPPKLERQVGVHKLPKDADQPPKDADQPPKDAHKLPKDADRKLPKKKRKSKVKSSKKK